jgi:hypothetical protein
MSKILKSFWFKSFQGKTGLVIVDTNHEKKVYIGTVSSSYKEETASNLIHQYGGEIKLKDLEEIVEILKKP